MTKTDAHTETPVQIIALSRLTLSPLNPRQTVTDDEVAALAESIRAVGLLQNLAGIEAEDGGVAIVAGGRRLRALRKVAEDDGTDPAAVMVPVVMADSMAEAEAWAGVENVARAPLHPADEVRAFATMAEGGAPNPTIAKAFGVTVRHVAGRLKLAVLPKAILDALRADEITLDTAAAYTLADDDSHALEVFERMSGTWHCDDAQAIKRTIKADAERGDQTVAAFVGRARYEAEGGTVTEDLFGEDVFFDDPALLKTLALAQLATAAETIRAEGWKWVEVDLTRPDWMVTEKMGRTYPKRVDPAEGEADRYDELAEAVEYGEATDAEAAEFAELSARLDAETYSETQKAHAGMFVYLSHRGEIETAAGYVKVEDRKAAEAAGVCRKNLHTSGGKSAPKGPYSAALTADLGAVRTAAVQTALLAKPELALDLLTFALTTPLYAGSNPIGISSTDARNAPDEDPGLTVDGRIEAKPHDCPLDAKGAVKAFDAFRAKPKKDRVALLTETIAKIVGVGMAGDDANPFAERIASLVGADIRSIWTPTRAFLGRLKGDQLNAIMTHIDGASLPASFAKMKKGEKVERLHRVFAEEPGIPPLTAAQKKRAATWVPEGMAVKAPARARAAPKAKAKKTAPAKTAVGETAPDKTTAHKTAAA